MVNFHSNSIKLNYRDNQPLNERIVLRSFNSFLINTNGSIDYKIGESFLLLVVLTYLKNTFLEI